MNSLFLFLSLSRRSFASRLSRSSCLLVIKGYVCGTPSASVQRLKLRLLKSIFLFPLKCLLLLAAQLEAWRARRLNNKLILRRPSNGNNYAKMGRLEPQRLLSAALELEWSSGASRLACKV